MLRWRIKQGIISELGIGEIPNIISPWGVETADEWSFFSLEPGVGYRYESQVLSEALTNQNHSKILLTQMRQGKFKLTLNESLNDNKVRREVTLEAIEDTLLMDFVLRFCFKKEYFNYALINGYEIFHKNSNIYHQYTCDSVKLFGSKIDIVLNTIEAQTSNRFTPQMYVRDRLDEWIVHARMMPKKADLFTIKLCNKLFKTTPLPKHITNLLFKIPKVKEALLYRGERQPFLNKLMRWLNPNAFKLCYLKKGEVLKWDVEVICSYKREL